MLKKLFVTAAAAAAVSVPLAGAAWADPTGDNPGVPGNIGSGNSPGSIISDFAKAGERIPPAPGPLGAFNTPGAWNQQFVPGKLK